MVIVAVPAATAVITPVSTVATPVSLEVKVILNVKISSNYYYNNYDKKLNNL